MATVKLGHFSPVQKGYIIACLANKLCIKEILRNFGQVFPEFGSELDTDVLAYKLARRISDIKRKNADDIEAYRDTAKTSLAHQIAHIPLTYIQVRQRHLQELYDTSENTKDRLAILKAIRKGDKT